MKFCSLLLALSIASPLLAGGTDLTEIPENGWETFSSKKRFTPPPREEEAIEQPKKQQAKEKNLFLIDLSAVYLRPYQGGTDFVQVVSVSDIAATSPFANQEPYGKNKALDFDYDWGARGALGYEWGKSGETLKATYLYFASDAHKSSALDISAQSIPTEFLFSTFFADFSFQPLPFGTAFSSAKADWNLHFNMLDLTFGKKFFRKKCMTFEPFIGAKGVLLSETQKYTYSVPLQVFLSCQLKQKIEFQGVGPVAGFNLDWKMASWLSFTGTIDGALLYSSSDTKRTSDNVLPTIDWIAKSNDVKGTPALEASFALRGVYCFKRGQFIDLKVGFEEHYFFEIMKHNLQNADSSTNLSLMGWFATLGFGF